MDFLEQQDLNFWKTWDQLAEEHVEAPRTELDAQLVWIGERANLPSYRRCPQINISAKFATEFPEASHPTRELAKAHSANRAAA
jgi:hypothetical protein